MIYFDNSATSYPKPLSVIRRGINALKNYSFNSGRGGYKESIQTAEMIYSVRESVGKMFDFSPENVIFTKNCTEALNTAIKGVLKKGDHVIISSLEHNSVSRVIKKLSDQMMIEYSIAAFSFDEDECVSHFKECIKQNTKAIICMHSSNVFGCVFPIAKIGRLCRDNEILFIVDAAQGAGAVPISGKLDNIDILCAPGHKCLMGPMGIGLMAVRDGLEPETLMEGGTGSNSLSFNQPDYLPDRFESGTLNNSGILALGEGIRFINTIGMEEIYSHEMELYRYLYMAVNDLPHTSLYTPLPENGSFMPILSFNLKDYSSEKTASLLAEHNICTRAGYHCSPLAHEHFGTVDRGTVRISFGYFNRKQEVKELINVLKKL